MDLGIDIGSSSIKGGVLDLEAGVVREIRSRPFPAPRVGLPSSWFEVDLEAIHTATREVLDELARSAPSASRLWTCCQMGGLVLTDADGHGIGPYYSWRDQRALDRRSSTEETHWDWLRRLSTPEELAAVGNELRPGSAITLLSWLAQRGELPPQRPFFPISLGDYLVARWTGTAPRSEPTLALGTLDLRTGQPASAMWLKQLGCEEARWPPVIGVERPVGTARFANREITCFPAIGDQQAALYGVDLQEGELSLNVSTGSQVSMLAREFQPGPFQTRPYFGGLFLRTITHLPAGRSLNGLVDLLTELSAAEGHPVREPWKWISEKVDQCPASDLDVDLAFFAGSLGERGHVANIRLDNLSVGSLFRASFRAMADNYVRCAERLSPDRRWRQVVISGGLAQRLPGLRQAIAERFGESLRSIDLPEETLGGLLRLAASRS